MLCFVVQHRVVEQRFRWDATNVEASAAELATLFDARSLQAELSSFDGLFILEREEGGERDFFFTCLEGKGWEERAGIAVDKTDVARGVANIDSAPTNRRTPTTPPLLSEQFYIVSVTYSNVATWATTDNDEVVVATIGHATGRDCNSTSQRTTGDSGRSKCRTK